MESSRALSARQQRCGGLRSDADYAQCAIEIDPAGGGKQLRYAGLADVLRRCAA